jgi:hypothetical protein
MTKKEPSIIIHSGRIAYSIKIKKEMSYYCYLVSREVNAKMGGSGLFYKYDFIALIQATLGVSRPADYRILNDGIGLFWSENKGKVAIRSILKVNSDLKSIGDINLIYKVYIKDFGFKSGFNIANEIKNALYGFSCASYRYQSMKRMGEELGVSYRTILRRLIASRDPSVIKISFLPVEHYFKTNSKSIKHPGQFLEKDESGEYHIWGKSSLLYEPLGTFFVSPRRFKREKRI